MLFLKNWFTIFLPKSLELTAFQFIFPGEEPGATSCIVCMQTYF